MSIIELEVARGHLRAAAGLYDSADKECSLHIQMAQAQALLVIAQELHKLNDSLSSIDLSMVTLQDGHVARAF